MICLAASSVAAQDLPEGGTNGSASQSPVKAAPQQGMPGAQDFDKYPGLLLEFGQLLNKLQQAVQFPAARGQSRLLPLLPESTVAYAAIPNYGESVHQALLVFQQERKESTVLSDWWQHGEVSATGPKVENALEKFYQLSQYLGDEIVVSSAIKDRNSSVLMLAEVKKPGLQAFIQQLEKEFASKSGSPLRIFDPEQLAKAKDESSTQIPLILVRSDFVVVGLELSTLRGFNAQLDRGGGTFVATPFGRRLAQAYEGGAIVFGGVDLQKIISQFPRETKKDDLSFQRTGFADVKYLIWEHKNVAGQAASQVELTFTGPRHGAASWLAAPAPIGGLDFVSPEADNAVAVVLRNPAQIFEELKELINSVNPGALASLAQAEEALKINIKEDLLSKLSGEITAELTGIVGGAPSWKVILRVNDPDGLQKTLSRLLAAVPIEAKRREEGGLMYYDFQIPSAQKPIEISYAFLEGYLVAASSPTMLREADRIHRSGASLARSEKLRAAMPPGHSAEASGLFYQNVGQFVAAMSGQLPPDLAKFLPQLTGAQFPVNLICAYGEESALREASKGSSFDLGIVLVAAAIAIPNLLRSKIAANEASAVGMVRTVVTAQIVYSATYGRGFAPDLATLGPDVDGGTGEKGITERHASLIDSSLGNAACTSGTWCTRNGYRFSVAAACKKQSCGDFVIVASPVSESTGTRNFCSTADGVIRMQTGRSLTSPVSASQCQSWSPIR